jgi:hypothetical protein
MAENNGIKTRLTINIDLIEGANVDPQPNYWLIPRSLLSNKQMQVIAQAFRDQAEVSVSILFSEGTEFYAPSATVSSLSPEVRFDLKEKHSIPKVPRDRELVE